MDYSPITENDIQERFNSLPDHIQDLLSSEQIGRLVSQIGKSHFLGKEKVETLEQVVTLILLGFVNLRDLKQELSEQLFLNYAHTVALAKELQVEIFSPIRGDLEQIYEPIEAEGYEVSDGGELGETPNREPNDGSFTVPVEEDGGDENKPLILHEETSTKPASTVGESKFGDLSKAFSFFRPKADTAGSASPTPAKVETPKDEKRTVHYSELRTPITPFGQPSGSDFISLEAFGRSDLKPISVKEQPATKPQLDTINPTVKTPETAPGAPMAGQVANTNEPTPLGVTLEGNQIDLRTF